MSNLSRIMFLSVLVTLLGLLLVNSSMASEEQQITEEDLIEIEENMEPVSPENPTSTYTTESGVTVERSLGIEEVNTNDNDVFEPLSTSYRETRVSLQESYWIQNVTRATFTGAWNVGVQRDGPVDILSWDRADISLTFGSRQGSSTHIDQTRGTSNLNPAVARYNLQLSSATFPDMSDSERNVDWIVNITPDLSVSGSISRN